MVRSSTTGLSVAHMVDRNQLHDERLSRPLKTNTLLSKIGQPIQNAAHYGGMADT